MGAMLKGPAVPKLDQKVAIMWLKPQKKRKSSQIKSFFLPCSWSSRPGKTKCRSWAPPLPTRLSVQTSSPPLPPELTCTDPYLCSWCGRGVASAEHTEQQWVVVFFFCYLRSYRVKDAVVTVGPTCLTGYTEPTVFIELNFGQLVISIDSSRICRPL